MHLKNTVHWDDIDVVELHRYIEGPHYKVMGISPCNFHFTMPIQFNFSLSCSIEKTTH